MTGISIYMNEKYIVRAFFATKFNLEKDFYIFIKFTNIFLKFKKNYDKIYKFKKK